MLGRTILGKETLHRSGRRDREGNSPPRRGRARGWSGGVMFFFTS